MEERRVDTKSQQVARNERRAIGFIISHVTKYLCLCISVVELLFSRLSIRNSGNNRQKSIAATNIEKLGYATS